MSKRSRQMDSTACPHPLTQGLPDMHRRFKSPCLFPAPSHKPPAGARGDYWNITYFWKSVCYLAYCKMIYKNVKDLLDNEERVKFPFGKRGHLLQKLQECSLHKVTVLRGENAKRASLVLLPSSIWAIPSSYWCFINSFIFFLRKNSILIDHIDTTHFLWLNTLNHHKKSLLSNNELCCLTYSLPCWVNFLFVLVIDLSAKIISWLDLSNIYIYI